MAILSIIYRSPLAQVAALIFFALSDFVLVGFSADLNKSDWGTWAGSIGTWIGSIGTVGTLIGTIILATQDRKGRAEHRQEMMELTIAGYLYEFKQLQLHLGNCEKWAIVVDIRPETFASFVLVLESMLTWSMEDMAALSPLPNHAAKHLALTRQQILRVTASFRAMTTVTQALTPEIVEMQMNTVKALMLNAKQNLDIAIVACDEVFIPSFHTR